MLDIDFIRAHGEVVRQAAKHKQAPVDVDRLLELDERRRALLQQLEAVAAQRNSLAQRRHSRPDAAALERGRELKSNAQRLQQQWKEVVAEYERLLYAIPNIPSDDTPVGPDETANIVLREVGERPTFDFPPQELSVLGPALGLLNTDKAAEVAGSRFAYLMGELVQLQLALLQLALSVLTDEAALRRIAREVGLLAVPTPFIPVIPPMMIRPAVMNEMARLEPREERYYIDSDDVYLVGSAEHTLGPLHRGEVLSEQQLPRRYVGYSTSFRREAGSYGKDLKGLLRLHHFDKLEIESFTTPEQSLTEHYFIIAIQEHLMQQLGLPYRVVLKCTAEMGMPNFRAVDIETWLPGQRVYRETHTADLMNDFQARRLKTKVRRADGRKEYVHMNDATVFAMGRTLTAIVENYQQADGSVAVPTVLQAYVPFTRIAPEY